mgnify:CR=1 FL=1
MNLTQAFTTPIYENIIQNKNVDREFEDVIESLKQNNKFQLNTSTECQLLSDTSFTENLFDTGKLEIFKSYLQENIKNYVKMVVPNYVTNRNYDFNIDSSWLTLNKKGHYSHLHHHADSDISGVYYVRTNGYDGNLVIENPNRLSTTSYLLNTWQESLHIRPEPNKLILFPGWIFSPGRIPAIETLSAFLSKIISKASKIVFRFAAGAFCITVQHSIQLVGQHATIAGL